MIERRNGEYRTGIGTDIHRIVEGRKLMLCGVYVPYPAGLAGHSDGDVGLHAVIDALQHRGVTNIDMPVLPGRVWQALQDSEG